MEKFEGIVKFVKEYSFTTSYNYYSCVDIHVYKFVDKEDKIYIWKTTKHLSKETKVAIPNRDDDSWEIKNEYIPVGSTIKILASIKGENDYHGEHQILLTRVVVEEIVKKALTKEEKDDLFREEQIDSLEEGDFIYEMSYRQFKEHYADCETLIGSYNQENRTIGVIIRSGRLKNSGVRFQKFSTYKFKNEDGNIQCRYAVCEENARRRVENDFPNDTWTFVGITR